MIYRGAGWLTLFTPVAMVLLLMWLWPDPSVKPGNTSLMQVLIGSGWARRSTLCWASC